MSVNAETFQDFEEPELESLEAPDNLDDYESTDGSDLELGKDAVDGEEEADDQSNSDNYKSVEKYDSVREYLKNIGKVALLNAADEVELSKKIEAGLYARQLLNDTENRKSFRDDTKSRTHRPVEERRGLAAVAGEGERAKNHLTEANLRLVVSIAKRYTGHGLDFLELIQEGNLGLIRAVEKFDYTKGYKFSTYATWWIRQAVTRGLADKQRTIRLPIHMVEKINKVGRVKRDMSVDLGRAPTDEELGQESGFTVDDIRKFARVAKDPISLDMSVNDESDSTVGDFVADTEEDDIETIVETTHMNQSLRDNLHNELKNILTERQYEVMVYRNGLDGHEKWTLDEIGVRLRPAVSRERIRQIEVVAKRKILQSEDGKLLKNLLSEIDATD